MSSPSSTPPGTPPRDHDHDEHEHQHQQQYEQHDEQQHQLQQQHSSEQQEEQFSLFVGQLPPDFSDGDILSLFAPYHAISSKLLIHPQTGKSKCCGFVVVPSRQDAEAAIADLHENKQIPPSPKPLVVKFSHKHHDGSEAGDKRGAAVGGGAGDKEVPKLYVANFDRSTTEDEIRSLLSSFGSVVELVLLRENGARFRGVAFVRMASREEAENAIDGLNEKHRDKQSPHNLTVRWANVEKSKQAPQQQQQQQQQQRGGRGSSSSGAAAPGGFNNFMPNMMMPGMMGMPPMPMNMNMGMNMGMPPMPMNMNMMGMPNMMGMGMPPFNPSGSHMNNQAQLFQQYGASNPYAASMLGNVGMPPLPFAPSMPAANSKAKGPDGSNLFVYGLPSSYADADLQAMFTNFGQVVGARVFRDLKSGASKGFGFVSFDNAATAQQAMQAMDGFMLQGKKLSVKPKTDKPNQGGGARANNNNNYGTPPGIRYNPY